MLIDGVTGDAHAQTVDIRSNAFLGDSVELYSAELKTVNWISSTSLLVSSGLPSSGITVEGRRVTWDAEFFDRSGTLDTSKHVAGHLDVTCP